ncbi:hypothetical protein ACWFOP_23810 [Bacillus mycoides]
MANISNEELEKILFPPEAIDFLEKHPSYAGRASKMYAHASVKCLHQKAKYSIKKIKDELQETEEMIDSNPRFFANPIN